MLNVFTGGALGSKLYFFWVSILREHRVYDGLQSIKDNILGPLVRPLIWYWFTYKGWLRTKWTMDFIFKVRRNLTMCVKERHGAPFFFEHRHTYGLHKVFEHYREYGLQTFSEYYKYDGLQSFIEHYVHDGLHLTYEHYVDDGLQTNREHYGHDGLHSTYEHYGHSVLKDNLEHQTNYGLHYHYHYEISRQTQAAGES